MGRVRFAEIARTSSDVAASSSRLAKIERLAACLRGLSPQEAPIAVAYLAGYLPQGSVGVGWASMRDLPEPARRATLELSRVDASFGKIAAASGPGSQSIRREALRSLFGRATEAEQRFLRGLLSGELRQGALEGVMVEAVARAAEVPAPEVRRAVMLAGDLPTVAAAALARGREGLAGFGLATLRPLKPMLAQTADSVADAFARLGSGPCVVEWKLDGARVQAHRVGDDVRLYTRNLADASDRVPELVEIVRGLDARSIVLDGEAIALHPDGRPYPFQTTMSRFGSRRDVPKLQRELPLRVFFFDCLHLDGRDLVDLPAVERFAAMDERLPEAMRTRRIVTDDAEEAERFLEDALARGHEGVMLKGASSPYEAGRRGASWLKVKRAHTLDLVVLAAEWGHGRRRGYLSNLHLGARDASSGGFVMLGKTFKGMTDEMLAWQTSRFQEIESHADAYTVYVRPELVVEVAFDGVQASTRYPGGLALRFARVKGYRPDKSPAEADTIETVRAIHAGGAPSSR
jgi:DNA ligase-1